MEEIKNMLAQGQVESAAKTFKLLHESKQIETVLGFNEIRTITEYLVECEVNKRYSHKMISDATAEEKKHWDDLLLLKSRVHVMLYQLCN